MYKRNTILFIIIIDQPFENINNFINKYLYLLVKIINYSLWQHIEAF